MKIKYLTTAVLAIALGSQFANAKLLIKQNDKVTKVGDSPAQNAQATLATPAKKANSSQYKLDPAHANVRFSIDHFGTTTNHGGFYGLTGDLSYDPAKRTGNIVVDIPMNSLDMNNEHFTNHLKSDEFFNVEKYPTAQFKSTKFHFKNGKVSQVDGQLTMLGKTNPVSLKATKFNCYDSPMLKAPVCGGDFETTIDRTQWGMDTYVKMGFSKNVKLNIQVEAVQQ